jgi:H/ACA ribonucleoprotein complex subunit 3
VNMGSRIRRCPACGRYTLSDSCPKCGRATVCPVPPRFSPDDRYGRYRRETLKEEFGADGKYHKI